MKPTNSHSLQEQVRPAITSLASPNLKTGIEATLDSEPFTTEEVKDFELLYKVMNSHSDNKVAQMMYDDMIDRQGYKNQRELFDRYDVFTKRYHNGQ